MKKLVGLALFLVHFGCSDNSINHYECSNDNLFIQQIEEYLGECSLQYFKIRACDEISVYSVYDTRAKHIWDSLAVIYPDSMKYLIQVGDIPNEVKFTIGESQLEGVPKHLKNTIDEFEIEVEYEVDLGCCDEKICNSYFRFNSDSLLESVEESDFYLTMPRHSKEYFFENQK